MRNDIERRNKYNEIRNVDLTVSKKAYKFKQMRAQTKTKWNENAEGEEEEVKMHDDNSKVSPTTIRVR